MISIKEYLINNHIDLEKLEPTFNNIETIQNLEDIKDMMAIKYKTISGKYIYGLATGLIETQENLNKIKLYFRVTDKGAVNFDKNFVITNNDLNKLTYVTQNDKDLCKYINAAVHIINKNSKLLQQALDPDYTSYDWIARICSSNKVGIDPSNALQMIPRTI